MKFELKARDSFHGGVMGMTIEEGGNATIRISTERHDGHGTTSENGIAFAADDLPTIISVLEAFRHR